MIFVNDNQQQGWQTRETSDTVVKGNPQRGSEGTGGVRRHGMMGCVVDLCATCIQGAKAFVAHKIPSDWDPLVHGKGRQEDCCDSVSVEIGIPCILRAETNDRPYCESSSVRLPT